MNITQEDVPNMAHKEWLSHPVTKQYVAMLEGLKKSFMQTVVNTAAEKDSDQELRNAAYGARTITSALNLAINTELFVKQLEKKDK